MDRNRDRWRQRHRDTEIERHRDISTEVQRHRGKLIDIKEAETEIEMQRCRHAATEMRKKRDNRETV